MYEAPHGDCRGENLTPPGSDLENQGSRRTTRIVPGLDLAVQIEYRLMRRAVLHSVGPGCFAALLLIIYRPVLFEDGQVSRTVMPGATLPRSTSACNRNGARDVGRSGYPARQNGGAPLLGNPTAAVFYPGKILYGAASLPMGGSDVRDRARGHRLLRRARAGSVVGLEPGRIVPGRPGLCLRRRQSCACMIM